MKKTGWLLFIFQFLLMLHPAYAQLYTSSIFVSGGTFTSGIEGPACDADGNLYVVNYQSLGDIALVTPAGACSVFVTLPGGSRGNGIRFHSDGSMLVADYTAHNILKIDIDTKDIVSYVYNPSMNQPNDLAIMENNIVFCSDPNWGGGTGNIWRVNLDQTSTLLESGMSTTNGIEVAPGDNILYVNESGTQRVWIYDLSPAGEISNKRLFHQFTGYGMDGMRCDIQGNLFVTRFDKGTVAMLEPTGILIREIDLINEDPTNIAFGGPDGCTAYVTMAGSYRGIETFRTEYPGRAWSMMQSVDEPAPSVDGGTLSASYPNPFSSAVSIAVPSVFSRQAVEVRIVDSAGRQVRTINVGYGTAKDRTLSWDGKDDLGRAVPGGIYSYRLILDQKAVGTGRAFLAR